VKLVGALLAADRQGVKQVLGELAAVIVGGGRAETVARAEGMADVARWALERVVALEAHDRFEIGRETRGHKFLALLHATGPMLNAAVLEELDLSQSDVSKVGRRLREGGFVIRRKLGREVLWELTPRGEVALARLAPG
jgi:DNA-binding transcriptional ArsR family regulator